MKGSMLEWAMKAAYKVTTIGLRTGPHVTRYFMYRHLSQFCADRAEDSKVLSVSGSKPLARLLGFSDDQILDVKFPEFNVLSLSFENNKFDAVVSDQVLEHVEGNPQHAIDELFRVLKPGGLALHTTCFINPVHGCPNDFWRFSPEGLRLLAATRGEIIDANGWGNPYVWPFVGLGLRFMPIPDAKWHPAHWLATKNVDKWPIVTWVMARKSSDADHSSH